MELLIPWLLIAAGALLLYLNLVATLLTAIDPTINGGLKVVRGLITWLLPVIGCALVLRFSEQEHGSQIHRKLLPGFIRRWLYASETQRPYSYADRRERRSGWNH